MAESAPRRFLDDLEEVVGRDLQDVQERGLNRDREGIEALVVLAGFRQVDAGEGYGGTPRGVVLGNGSRTIP